MKATTMKHDVQSARSRPALAAALLAAALAPAAAAADLPAGLDLRFELAAAPEQAVPAPPSLGTFPVQLVLDDGTAEGTVGVADQSGAREFLWFNRFAWPGAPFDLAEVWVLFPAGANIAVGDAVQLAVYHDPDSDPTNGADLFATFDETIQAADGVTFSIYTLAPRVSFTDPGDVLIGVVPRFIEPGDPPTGPAAVDTTASQQRSWIAIWSGDPPDPPELPPDLLIDEIDDVAPAAAGNWMIRGFGEPPPPPVVAIPALDGSGLAILVLLLAAAGFVAMRRLRGRHGAAALGLVLLAAAAALAPAAPASAQVVIDEFSTGQGPLSDPPGGASTAVTGGADILGGARSLRVRNFAGPGPTTAQVTGGAFDFTVAATTPDSRGEADLVWDEDDDSDATTLDPTGLGGVDLTGGGTQGGIRIDVEQAQAGTHLVLTIYEDADNVSRAGRVLPAIASTTSVFINFGELVQHPDATGPADLTAVGAVTLRIGAVESPSSPTLRISHIATAPPAVAATKVVATPVGPVQPGGTIRYRVTITNPGAGGAEGVDFDDDPAAFDANLGAPSGTRTTPLARRDQYRTVTNTQIGVNAANGVLGNDSDLDTDPLAVGGVPGCGDASPPFSCPTPQGGTVVLQDTGAFVYTPAAGFQGVDSFPYSIAPTAGDPPGGPFQSTAYVVIDRVPPVVTTSAGVTAFTEDGGPVVVDGAVTVTDADSPNLASATVTITNLLDAGLEVLAANTGGTSITANYAAPTLTLTGSDTVANYQQVLRTVTYDNTSQDPDTTSRILAFVANDGTETSNTATKTVSVTAVNDAPVVTTTGGVTSFTEDGGPVVVDSGLTVTDVDDANLESATVTLAPSPAPDGAAEVLAVASPGANCPGLTVTPGNPLTITGSQSLAVYQTCLRNVTYDNSDQAPDTANRTVGFTVNDGDVNSNTATKTVTVTAVNDLIVFTTDPIAYTTPGNTQLHVAGRTRAGVAAHTDAQSALTKSGPTDVDGPAAPSVVPFAGATPNGFIDIIANGSFHYVPNAGFVGVDTFTVQVTDGADPVNLTINMTVAQTVWYVRDVVDSDNPAGGDGRSTDAFETLTAAAAASVTADDYIFVFAGNTATTPLVGGVALENGEKLHGQGIGLTVTGFPQLVAPGARPRVRTTTATTDVVQVPATAGARQNVEIRGLDLEATGATSNAIDATATGANALGLRVSENTIRGATAEGVDVNAGATVAALLALHDNTLTAGGTAVDVQRTGTGALTVTAFANNVVTAASTGSGIVVNGASGPVVFDAVPGGGFDPVSFGTTVIGGPGDGVGGAGLLLTNVAGDLPFTDLDVFTDAGAALRITGTGAINVGAGTGTRATVPVGVSILQATGGPALDLSTLTADFRLSSLVSTSSATTGLSLSNVSDAVSPAFNAVFSAGAGSSITTAAGSTGPAFNVSGGNAQITYGGTITNNGTGRAVSITTWSGDDAADDLLLSGAIDENGSGILLNGNGGSRAITFSGGMDVDTTTGEGFAATSNTNTLGLHVTGTNTITSTSATALRVTSTTIGNSDITFQNVSSGNNTAAADPANGIVLSATGTLGGLKVTGTGASGQGGNGTGGLIQNTTSHGVSLNNTREPSFANLTIQNTGGSGVDGTLVTDFTFDNGTITGSGDANQEANIAFNGSGSLVGNNVNGVVTITDSVLNTAFDSGVYIESTDGTISTLTVSTNAFTSTTSDATSKGDAVKVVAKGTAATVAHVTRATIANNVIANFPSGAGIQVIGGNTSATGTGGFVGTPGSGTDVIAITGNSIAGPSAVNRMGTSAIAVSVNGGNSASRSQGNFNVSNNGTVANPLTNMDGTAILVGHNGYATGTYTMDNNVIVANNINASPGIGGGNGIVVSSAETPLMTWTITNNNISQTDGNGILAVSRGVTGTLNVGIRNNTVAAPLTGVRPGIRVDAGNAASVDDAVCTEIANNTSGGSGGHPGIGIRKQGTNATINDFGIEGLTPSPATCGQAEDRVSSQNPGAVATGTDCDGNPGSKTLAISGGNFVSCTSAP